MPLSDLWASESPQAHVDCDSESESGHQSQCHDSARLDDAAASASELVQLRKQNRTFKARVASLLSRQKKKIEAEAEAANLDTANVDPESAARIVFQQDFLASRATQWDPLEDSGTSKLLHSLDDANGRRRAVYTYFKAFADRVRKLFQWDSTTPTRIRHVISIHTNDDTNVKLGSGARGSAEVRSVMNNIQEHIVLAEQCSSNPVWFALHQPLVALERPDTVCLYSEFMSWILGFVGYVGWRLQVWGMPSALFQHVDQHTLCFVGDAIKVNDSLFKHVAQAVQQQSQQGPQSLALQVRCSIHQLSLSRKGIALGFTGYWSNLVRFGHLFESHSFRQRFKAALSKVVQNNFVYVEVTAMPADWVTWNKAKIDGLQLHSDVGHMGSVGGKRGNKGSSSRLKTLLKLIQKDNGDPETDLFVHFCHGTQCCPGGQDEALTSMIQLYMELFSHMPVPLLYRWKHGEAANNFISDGFFLHKIIPRTMAEMPAMKCSLA